MNVEVDTGRPKDFERWLGELRGKIVEAVVGDLAGESAPFVLAGRPDYRIDGKVIAWRPRVVDSESGG